MNVWISFTGMYAIASVQKGAVVRGSHTDLYSTVFGQTGSNCTVTFWYHMFGTDVGQLAVNVKSATRLYHKWHVFGNQEDEWQQANVTIGKHYEFELVFEATAGPDFTDTEGHQSDIAIDDVSFSNCVAGTNLESAWCVG